METDKKRGKEKVNRRKNWKKRLNSRGRQGKERKISKTRRIAETILKNREKGKKELGVIN